MKELLIETIKDLGYEYIGAKRWVTDDDHCVIIIRDEEKNIEVKFPSYVAASLNLQFSDDMQSLMVHMAYGCSWCPYDDGRDTDEIIAIFDSLDCNGEIVCAFFPDGSKFRTINFQHYEESMAEKMVEVICLFQDIDAYVKMVSDAKWKDDPEWWSDYESKRI